MLRRRRARQEEHEDIKRRLFKEELATEEMRRRVRILEIEAGIYNPHLREVNGE